MLHRRRGRKGRGSTGPTLLSHSAVRKEHKAGKPVPKSSFTPTATPSPHADNTVPCSFLSRRDWVEMSDLRCQLPAGGERGCWLRWGRGGLPNLLKTTTYNAASHTSGPGFHVNSASDLSVLSSSSTHHQYYMKTCQPFFSVPDIELSKIKNIFCAGD